MRATALPFPRLLAVLWLAWCACLGAAAATPDAAPPPRYQTLYESPRFVLEAPPPGLPDLDRWGATCEQTLLRLAPGFPVPRSRTEKIRVRVSPTRADFEQHSQMHAESAMAVAFPAEQYIVLNADALQPLGPLEQFQTVGHEMVHVLLGALERRANREYPDRPVSIPGWLHEGLAQLLVQNTHLGGGIQLAWANLVGRTIPMHELAASFPYGGPQSELAYAQSASFTSYIATRAYSFSRVEDFFHTLLGSTPQSRTLLTDLTHSGTVASLEDRWLLEIGGVSDWILIISSNTLIWGGLVLLFLLAYYSKRRHEKRVMDEWDSWEQDE